MYYPAKFDKEDNGYTVTFRDLPEAITCGSTQDEAMEMAEDVLLSCIEIYFEQDKLFPSPDSRLQKDEQWVYLPDSIYAKVLLHNTMIEQSVTKAQLARLTNIRPPEIQRILEPRHTTKIDTISRALSVLGKQLQLSIS